jgi:organic radical activating enzyme
MFSIFNKDPIKKYGSNFCAAPFTSLYEGQFNRISTCCATLNPIGYNNNITSFEEIVNSNEAKSIRKDFLNNKFPAQCDSCAKMESMTGRISGVREQVNRFGQKQIHTAVKNTQADGTMIKQTPAWLDLLWTNKCNFACMGCNSTLSSTIGQNYNSAYEIVNGLEPGSMPTNEWHNNNDAKIDYILKHQDTIDRIHLNGGEPFMQEGVYELLEVLLKHKLHKRIKIWAHTNGSITTYKGVDIIDKYLKHWRADCNIIMSHDCHGDRGEYIRFGLKQKKWLDTYNRLSETGIQIDVQTCYSVFNALVLEELYHWYLDNLKIKNNISINPWQGPTSFTANFLQINKDLLSKANTQLKNLEKQKYQGWDINMLASFLNSPVNDLQERSTNFIKGIAKFDELRKTDFVKTFPELQVLLKL